jgi:type I restriction enzyme S subunit
MKTIPPHWKKATLKDCCLRPEYGFTASASSEAVGSKFLRITDIQDGRVDWTTVPYLAASSAANGELKLKKGDLVVARIGATTGKAFLIDNCPDALFASYLIRIRTKPGTSPEFVNFYFQSDEYWNQINQSKGGRLKGGVNIPILENLSIPLPPFEEQRAIAHLLATVQQAKEARQRELALERERKAALMEHLFSHGTRGERTKKTEFGSIPESWKVSTLGALCEDHLGILQTGPFGSQLHASDYVETGVPVVNPTHLGFNSIDTERVPRVSKELADTLPKHYLLRGDILISRRGDFSRFAYIGEGESGWFCGTGCMLIRLANPAMDNYFLALSMSLNSTQTYLKNAAVGSIMPNLNTTILSQMPVLVPAIDEQRQIAAVICACERKIAVFESEIPVVEELFAAMLAELMSGRISTELLSKVLSTQ